MQGVSGRIQDSSLMFSSAEAVQPLSSSLPYRADVDGLRAIAVIAVVVYHAFPALLPGGFVGVDLFFIISGFLISSIIFKKLEEGTFSFREFYARRIQRIFPALIIVLCASYVGGWFVLPAPDFKRLANHIEGGIGFFSNFLLMKESGYFDAAAETKPLLHLWSLAIEEQFYIFWPFFSWLALRRKQTRLTLVLSGVVILFGITVLLGQSGSESAGLYYSPQTRCWELLIGAALAAMPDSTTNQRQWGFLEKLLRFPASGALTQANLKASAGTFLVLVSLFFITKETVFPGWWALLPTLGSALIIAGGRGAWINDSILSSRILVWIGLISFPLYLWHWPLLSFARIIATETPSVTVRAAMVCLSVVLAWLTRKCIEQPIRFSDVVRHKTAILLVTMLAIAAVSQFTFMRQGLSFRYGKPELDMRRGRLDCVDREKDSGCAFGNPSAKKLVLVWGDSHAEHLTNALRLTLGNQYRFRSVVSGSCFMGEHILIRKKENPQECTAAMQQLQTLRNENIYAIIRSQRWHGYGMTDKAEIERAIDDTLHAYGFHPEKMIIVGASPDVDIECAVANYYARPSAEKRACRDINKVKSQIRTFTSVTQAMHVPANVSFLYPYDILCPHDICTVIQGRSAYFSDTNHLSTPGAMLLMPYLGNLLKQTDGLHADGKRPPGSLS